MILLLGGLLGGQNMLRAFQEKRTIRCLKDTAIYIDSTSKN